MSAERQHTCAGCHGVIRGTRRFSLETAINNHNNTCPGQAKEKKR